MRRRWVQINGELVEVPLDYVQDIRPTTDRVLWNDRLYQDDGDERYVSRTQHRNYMRQNDLTTADDYRDQWRREEFRRVDYRSGKGHDPTRREHLLKAIHQLETKQHG